MHIAHSISLFDKGFRIVLIYMHVYALVATVCYVPTIAAECCSKSWSALQRSLWQALPRHPPLYPVAYQFDRKGTPFIYL